jgi:hypothetical protein
MDVWFLAHSDVFKNAGGGGFFFHRSIEKTSLTQFEPNDKTSFTMALGVLCSIPPTTNNSWCAPYQLTHLSRTWFPDSDTSFAPDVYSWPVASVQISASKNKGTFIVL